MKSDCTAPRLTWTPEGVPVSVRFDDPYYSLQDGLGEARHVFLGGNALAARWAVRPGVFVIAELGFGTGLNFLAAWALWRRQAAPGAVLDFASFEKFPLTTADLARALSAWPELSDLADALLSVWPELAAGRQRSARFGDARLTLDPGDARETVPRWQGRADAWFLDGFAPARNPEMWEPGLLDAVFRHTKPGGTAATFTAAGAVRRDIRAAGFEVATRPGFGRKREMTAARRPG